MLILSAQKCLVWFNPCRQLLKLSRLKKPLWLRQGYALLRRAFFQAATSSSRNHEVCSSMACL